MSNKIQLPPISNLLRKQDSLEPSVATYVDTAEKVASKSPQDGPKLAPLLQPMLPTFIQPSVTGTSAFPQPQQLSASSLPPPNVSAQVYPGQLFAPPLYALPTPANSSPSNTPPLNATNLFYYLYPSYVYTYQNGQPVVAAMAPGSMAQAYPAPAPGSAPATARAASTVVGMGSAGLPLGSAVGAKAPLISAGAAASVPPFASQAGVSGEATVSPGSQGAVSPSMIPPRERKPSLGNMSLDKTRKTRSNLPKETTFILLKWLNEHLNHPYPNSFEKNQLMLSTGLNQQQLSNWFINARRRKIKLLKEQTRINSV